MENCMRNGGRQERFCETRDFTVTPGKSLGIDGRELNVKVPPGVEEGKRLRLAALVEVDGEGARALARRLRLANAERDRLVALASPSWKLRLADDRHARRRALYHLGRERFCDVVLLRAAAVGDEGRRPARTLVAFAEKTRLPGFPLKGGDVVALGVAPGPRVKALLTEIATWWEAGDFRATRKACLAALARRIGPGDA